jgi:chromosome segregation ATPase
MSLWNKLGKLLGKTSSDKNLLDTPEGREKVRAGLEEDNRKLDKADQQIKEMKAFSEKWKAHFAANIQQIDRLDQRATELLQRLPALSNEAKDIQKQGELQVKLGESLTARYKIWEVKFQALNKSSPTYEADKAKLLQERQQLEDELTRLEKESASSTNKPTT